MTDYEALAPVQWPVNAANPAGTRRLFGDGRFFTPSGRARLVAVHAASPCHDGAAEYPFVLITGRVRDQWHTMTRTARAARLLRHIDAPAVSIHPGDAARLGVADGALVEVANERGRLCLPAELSDDAQARRAVRADALERAVRLGGAHGRADRAAHGSRLGPARRASSCRCACARWRRPAGCSSWCARSSMSAVRISG